MVRRKSRWERRQRNGRLGVTGDEPRDKRPWDIKFVLKIQRKFDRYINWRMDRMKEPRDRMFDRDESGPTRERRLPGWRYYRHQWFGGPINWYLTNRAARKDNYDIIKVVKQW